MLLIFFIEGNKMSKPLLLFAVVFLFHKELSRDQRDVVVFWDVGQGSWTTLITGNSCLHVDAGGRHRPLASSCRSRKNFLWFTHYDWDHINQARRMFMTTRGTCLMQVVPPHLKEFKRNFLGVIPACKEFRGLKKSKTQLSTIHKSRFLKNNDSSVFLLAGKILITGDATQKMEKKWLSVIPADRVQILLAGHHGSRTSLSPLLLKKLRQLRMVVVSAEKKKYGHPHKETVKKLKDARIPMIKTEDFGSIAMEL
jgi:competence protein ComEC